VLHRRLNNFKNFIIEFYGITQDPETKDYIMVLKYAEKESLRNYLDANYNKLNWNNKINHILEIARGLDCIHKNGFIHRDLHSGNILMSVFYMWIADMGLCKPADYNPSKNAKNNIYGVLPYVAPEVLRGQDHTKAADIYSFGIIMYEMISGLPPYHDNSHDENLAIKICKGLRPRFNIKVPQLIIHLIKKCVDADPLNRPKAEESKEILSKLYRELYNIHYFKNAEIRKQIEEAEMINNELPTSELSTSLGISYETHSEAIYTSRLLNFSNLPEPKNSDDYYKQNDNIIVRY
jgi:serine/threonine protein kinase